MVINTAVSSKMLSKFAEVNGLRYEETLTGFKWMGNKVMMVVDLICYLIVVVVFEREANVVTCVINSAWPLIALRPLPTHRRFN